VLLVVVCVLRVSKYITVLMLQVLVISMIESFL